MSNSVLSQEQLQALLRKFKEEHGEKYRLLALGYFGSYARNEATEESDVDVVFETDYPNLFKASAMRLDLEELIGKPVGVVRFEGIDDPRFKARVEKDAIYV